MDSRQALAFIIAHNIVQKRKLKEKRKKKCWVRKWVDRRSDLRAASNLVNELRLEDAQQCKNFIRFVQYGSKTAWHYMEKKDFDTKSIQKFKNLEQSLAAFRKLLSFGRFTDSLNTALLTVNHPNIIIKYCVTFSKIAHSLFLLCDHFIWLNRNSFIQINAISWGQVGNRYWLLSIIMNLVRDTMELNNLMNAILKKKILNTLNRKVAPKEVFTEEAVQFICNHKDLLIDTVKNTCDLMLPLTNLGIVRLSPSTIGVIGMTSSLLSLYTLMDKSAKLPYS